MASISHSIQMTFLAGEYVTNKYRELQLHSSNIENYSYIAQIDILFFIENKIEINTVHNTHEDTRRFHHYTSLSLSLSLSLSIYLRTNHQHDLLEKGNTFSLSDILE